MGFASSGNFFYQALTSSLSMNSSIQQNYVTDASLANDKNYNPEVIAAQNKYS